MPNSVDKQASIIFAQDTHMWPGLDMRPYAHAFVEAARDEDAVLGHDCHVSDHSLVAWGQEARKDGTSQPL